MPLIQNGALRLFRVFGISVFLHWSWALVAIIELQLRKAAYVSQFWNVAEYLTLFGIVLLHEFGHALACRSVGGAANRIMLWPLGGVAFVSPPPRPGAQLWSIAAGPLVNVVLLPATIMAAAMSEVLWPHASRDFHHYLFAIAVINVALLVFNLLPIYPLDGGQILRSLLWFFVGPIRSLIIAATIGLIGAVAGIALAGWHGDMWLVVLALFAASRSWSGLQAARAMSALRAAARYAGVCCPVCREPPPAGPFWRCSCGARFDTFANQGLCPKCQRLLDTTSCPLCGRLSPMPAWYVPQEPQPNQP